MRTWAACLALLLLASPAGATPIVLSGSSAWNLGAGAFWDNPSYDGNGFANVGVYLSGTPGSDVPGFYVNSPGAVMPYLGDGGTTFTFTIDSPADVVALQGVTAWQDSFVLIPWGAPNQYALGFQTPYHLWRSDTLDAGWSHFAVFRGDGFYYVGMEDIARAGRPDNDHNDLIVRIPESRTVPEAGGTIALLAAGLAAMGAWRVRR